MISATMFMPKYVSIFCNNNSKKCLLTCHYSQEGKFFKVCVGLRCEFEKVAVEYPFRVDVHMLRIGINRKAGKEAYKWSVMQRKQHVMLLWVFDLNWSPHWTKWPPFRRRHFRCISLKEKFHILIKISLKFVPKGPIDSDVSFGLDNGLAPNRRQAIILTHICCIRWVNNTLCPRQAGSYFADDIFKCPFYNEIFEFRNFAAEVCSIGSNWQ